MKKFDNRMGVIFDLDGVLVDTGWAHKQSWYDLAEKGLTQLQARHFVELLKNRKF